MILINKFIILASGNNNSSAIATGGMEVKLSLKKRIVKRKKSHV